MYWASLGIFKVHIKQLRQTYHSASDCQILSTKIGPSATELWRHIFSRWRSRHRNSTSGFGFRDYTYLGRSKSTFLPNFGENISIHGCDITTSGFEKQMSAMLELYFRFRFLHLHHHRHVILHLPTKFRPNRTIRDGVMTSYPFFKMAATAMQFYFRFRFSWFRLSGKVEI